jgi:hypothetical protein
MKTFAALTLGLAFAGAAAAQAQTVTHQITSEPVETTVIQGPNGPAVTRRILSPVPGVTTLAPPAYYEQAPLPPEALSPDFVETRQTTITRPAPASTRPVPASTRPIPASRPATVGVATQPATTRTVRTAKPARPIAPRIVSRTVTRTVAAPVPSDAPLALNWADRDIIYRTLARRDYVPAPVPYYGPPVVAQTEIVPPPGYPPAAVYLANSYAYGYAAPGSYRDRYVYRWDGVPLVVGARIPASVPLVAVPEAVALQVPVTRPYSYALIDGRVYLVDPATSIIVADLTP